MSFAVYIGTKPCHCTVACCVDDPKYIKDTAKTIAKWVRDGWRVTRLTVKSGADIPLQRCTHNKAKIGQVTP